MNLLFLKLKYSYLAVLLTVEPDSFQISWTLIVPVIFLILILFFIFYSISRSLVSDRLRYRAKEKDIELPDFFEMFRWKYFLKIKPSEIVEAMVEAKERNVTIQKDQLVKIKLQKHDIKEYLEALKEAESLNLPIKFKELYHFVHIGGDARQYVEIKRKIHNAKLDDVIDSKVIEIYFHDKGDIKFLVNIAIKAEDAHLNINFEELVKHDFKQVQIQDLIESYIIIKNANIDDEVTLQDLMSLLKAGISLRNYVNSLIKAHNAGLTDLSKQQLIQHAHAGGDMENYVTALVTARNSGLDVSLKEIQTHYLAGVDVISYVKAIKASQDIDITSEQLEAHSIKGGDAFAVVMAYKNAKNAGLDIPFPLLSVLDIKVKDIHISELVKQTLSPKLYQTHEFCALTKDGILLKIPHVNVSLKLIIQKYFSGASAETLLERVNEAMIHEIESFDSHEEVLRNLKIITEYVKNKLQGEKEFNLHSKYELIDVSIPNVIIDSDNYEKIKRQKAEIRAHEISVAAEAELKRAEAKVEEAFAEAIRSGKIKGNELHKHGIYKERFKKIKPEHEQEHNQENKHSHHNNSNENHHKEDKSSHH